MAVLAHLDITQIIGVVLHCVAWGNQMLKEGCVWGRLWLSGCKVVEQVGPLQVLALACNWFVMTSTCCADDIQRTVRMVHIRRNTSHEDRRGMPGGSCTASADHNPRPISTYCHPALCSTVKRTAALVARVQQCLVLTTASLATVSHNSPKYATRTASTAQKEKGLHTPA